MHKKMIAKIRSMV